MPSAYEIRLIFSWLANIIDRLSATSPARKGLTDWLEEYGDWLGVPPAQRDDNATHRRRPRRGVSATSADWQDTQAAIEHGRKATARTRRDRTAARLHRLANALDLSATDVTLVDALLRYETQPMVEELFDGVLSRVIVKIRRVPALNVRHGLLAHTLGISPQALLRRLDADRPLVSCGLVSVDQDGDLALAKRLLRLASPIGEKNGDVRTLLLDPAPPAELKWSDFDHIAEGRDHIERLMRGALEQRAAGVNVLLHGPPGTGKTEFCKTLAHRLGVTLYSVGEADEDGDEPSRHERLLELRLAQRLVSADESAMLLFDEMEDLLESPDFNFAAPGPFGHAHGRTKGSKVFMNRLLEQAQTPTLWTTNSAPTMRPSLLRRMMFALELGQPPLPVRDRIWARQLARHGIECEEGDTRALATDFDVAPAVAAGSTAAAALCGGDVATVRRGVRAMARLLNCEKPPRSVAVRFDPALNRADIDLVAISNQLAASGELRFSLCLQGPPGTGKSAFARHLAERLGLEVEQKRASDLMSMYVGQTERLIAQAFADARDQRTFLIFDEADSLLSDRRFAHRSWEVSQVNEMLTWMESHPLPFACTTNFNERLDRATLRRFTFKIEMDYLSAEQAGMAFQHYFGLAAPEGVSALTNLTPGDFPVVRRRAEILGLLGEAEMLARMLLEECEAKGDALRSVGFDAVGSVPA